MPSKQGMRGKILPRTRLRISCPAPLRSPTCLGPFLSPDATEAANAPASGLDAALLTKHVHLPPFLSLALDFSVLFSVTRRPARGGHSGRNDRHARQAAASADPLCAGLFSGLVRWWRPPRPGSIKPAGCCATGGGRQPTVPTKQPSMTTPSVRRCSSLASTGPASRNR